MRTVIVETVSSYPVWIERGGARRAGELLESLAPSLAPSGWALVSDARVAALYGELLCGGLARWGSPAATVLMPRGSRAKTWKAVGEGLRALASSGLERGGVVLCLGGGSLMDAGGFLAATYLRGIDHVNVPTTLLAAVDASIGGKTGVDLPEGKNLAGAFHQPRAVIADPDLLSTLPEPEWRNGWAEAIKIAITSDPPLFELLESESPLSEGGPLELALELACRAKAAIVSADEREAGPRRVLNFGHTVGHAIEAAGGFARYSHGESVALGISCALELGVRLGVTPSELAARCRELLRRFGLPTQGSGYGPEALSPFLRRDKKSVHGVVPVVLTMDIGRPILRRLTPEDPALLAAIRSIA